MISSDDLYTLMIRLAVVVLFDCFEESRFCGFVLTLYVCCVMISFVLLCAFASYVLVFYIGNCCMMVVMTQLRQY